MTGLRKLARLTLSCSLLHAAAPSLQSEEELTGALWDVVIIEAGRSLNGETYTAEVLRKAAPLFEGVPIFAYQLGKVVGHADDEAAAAVEGKGYARNLVGEITDVRWDERRRALVGRAHIDDPAVREVLKNQWERSGRTMLGLSIDARGFKGDDEEVGRLVRANSVDIVTYPAAGGRFLRLAAAAQAGVRLLEQERFTDQPWDGSASRFSLEQLERAVPRAVLDWARGRAEREERELTKADLKLPIREPDGRVNVNALRAVLAVLGGARGGVDLPQGVQNDVGREVRELLEEFNTRRAEGSTEEANVKQNLLASIDAQIKALKEQRVAALREQAPEAFGEIAELVEAVLMGAAADWPDAEKAPLMRALEIAKGHAMEEGMEEHPEATQVEETSPQPEPAPAPQPAPAAPAPPPAPSVPVPTVAHIRESADIQKMRADLEQAQAKAAAEQEALEAQKKRFEELAIKHALESACKEMRIVDQDAAARLMDTTGIEVSAQGEVSGLRESLQKLISEKPFLVAQNATQPAVQVQESIVKPNEPAGVLTNRIAQLRDRAKHGDLRAAADYRLAVRQARNGAGV